MRLLSETEALRELPIPPYAYGLIALVVFGVSLAITFAFRGAANRHNPAAFHAQPSTVALDGEDPHAAIGSGH